MAEQEQKKIGIQIKSIDILRTIIDFSAKISEGEGLKFAYDISADCTANLEEKVILSIANIQVRQDGSEHVLGALSAGFLYSITNFDEVIKVDEQKNVKIPTNIINFVNPLSLSSMRGLMFSAFKGTFLHTAILPIIDPKQFITEELKVD